jgi:hypothetical protein
MYKRCRSVLGALSLTLGASYSRGLPHTGQAAPSREIQAGHNEKEQQVVRNQPSRRHYHYHYAADQPQPQPQPQPRPLWRKVSALGLFYAGVSSSGGGLAPVQGRPEKWPGNPLLEQDVPWEPRIDNGYGNIVLERPSGRNPNHREKSSGGWKLFYGNCIDAPSPGAPGCHRQTLHFANSSDGISWTKPSLGLFDLSDSAARPWVQQRLRRIGSANNILMEGYGVGVLFDPMKVLSFSPPSSSSSPSSSSACAFKAFGEGQFNGLDEPPVKGIGCSADGLHWHGGKNITFSSSVVQRYDTHNNIIYDGARGEYIYTTRTELVRGREPALAASSENRVRSVAMFTSKPSHPTSDGADGAFGVLGVRLPSLQLTMAGSPTRQLYAQVTFPFYDAFLGIVMVYEGAENPMQARCEGKGTVRKASSGGVVNSCYGKLRVHCRLAFSADGRSKWRFVQGQHDFIPLGTATSSDFDSHICFAAATPIDLSSSAAGYGAREASSAAPPPSSSRGARGTSSGNALLHEARIYYFGGNGPHFGNRNTSLGLATLRTFDRFAGVGGTGHFISSKHAPVTVAGNTLVVTADALPCSDDTSPKGRPSVSVGIVGFPGFSLLDALPVNLFVAGANGSVTNAPLSFLRNRSSSAYTLSYPPLPWILPHSMRGRQVQLEISLNSAVLYTIGFIDRPTR